MAKPNPNHSNQGKPTSRDRYWSLMLVGDHGRIIPFRRFKGIAIAALAIVVIAVSALIVLAFLYKRQSVETAQLKTELEQVRQQIGQLRDEKDVLLAQLVIRQKMDPVQISTALEKVPQAKEKSDGSTPAPKEAEPRPATTGNTVEPATAEPPAKENKPEPPPAPAPTLAPAKVVLGAEIQQFKAAYRLERSLLQAEFRIYNRNKPREQLSGKCVVIFKNQNDPQTKWFSIPTVKISNGMPDSIQGKEFRIRNYRTMDFKAYGIKPPVKFNTVAAMIFSDDGTLILSKEFEVEIDVQAPPVPLEKPVAVPPQVPAPEKSETPPAETDTQSSTPKPQQVPEFFAPPSTPQPAAQQTSEAPDDDGTDGPSGSDAPEIVPDTPQTDTNSSVNVRSNR